MLRYRGREIGRWVCAWFGAVTMPGRLAVPVAPAKQGHPRGIRVYDVATRLWRLLEMQSDSLVGWVTR